MAVAQGRFLKKITVDLQCCVNFCYLRNRNRITDIENRLEVARRWVVEEVRWMADGNFGVGRCKILYLEWIRNWVLLYSTGNCI